MEKLIILIIIGALSALFGKGKVTKNQSKAKPFFEEFRTMIDNQIPKMTQANMETHKEIKSPQLKRSEMKHVQIIKEVEPPPVLETIPEINNFFQEQETVAELPSKTLTTDPAIKESPDGDTLINGIIWSEILGKPRSKKPYFARKG